MDTQTEQTNTVGTDTAVLLANYVKAVPPLLVASGNTSSHAYIPYLCASIQATLKETSRSILLTEPDMAHEGVALIHINEWESEYFGLPIGQIDHFYSRGDSLDPEGTRMWLNRCLDTAREWGTQLLYINIGASRLPLIKALAWAGFQFVFSEIAGIYGREELSRARVDPTFSMQYDLREYRPDDYDGVLSIGREFSLDIASKYTATPWLPTEKVRRYYLELVENSCRKKYGNLFYVLTRGNKVCGFNIIKADKLSETLLNKSAMYCALFGVGRSERKLGAGTHFSSASQEKLYTEKGIDVYSWKASLTNKPLINLIFKRAYTPHIEFMHTFCLKL